MEINVFKLFCNTVQQLLVSHRSRSGGPLRRTVVIQSTCSRGQSMPRRAVTGSQLSLVGASPGLRNG